MTDERDRYPRKTPPAGVLAQIAPPSEPDSWEDQSGGGRSSTDVKQTTGTETAVETIVRRTGETKNTVLDTAAKVDQTAAKVDKLEVRIESAHTIISEAVLPRLRDLHEHVVAQGDQNKQIIGLLLNERDRSGEIRTETTLSQVRVTETEQIGEHEVRKAKELSLIKQSEADRDARREVLKKVALQILVALSVAAGIAATAFQAGRC